MFIPPQGAARPAEEVQVNRGPRPPKGVAPKKIAPMRGAAPPDPELLILSGGRWHVRLAALTIAPAGPAASPAQLREILATGAGDLKAFGADTSLDATPDDLLAAAAVSGATTSMALLDILDGACFDRAPCLCCYVARSTRGAREAATALHMFCRYYDAGSYVRSRAYARAVASMSRDLRPEEAAEVKRHTALLDSTPDSVREINGIDLGDARSGGLCVVTPPCQPGVLWVYSTPEGRRLLRHLARASQKAGGGPVKVTVASSNPGTFPRFRYRMYAASPVADRAGAPALLDTALSWARARRQNA